ncbi:MAG: hypothetical protein ABJD97_05035 [Betaproteobacteria bacterium]
MSNAGWPRLPIRLPASLPYLRHSVDLSDEELVQRWSENIVWQCCGRRRIESFSGLALTTA